MALDFTQPTQADILSAFGVTSDKPAAPAAAAPDGEAAAPAEGAPPPTDPAPTDEKPKEPEGGDPKEPAKPAIDEKANQRFAEMRVQLNQYKTVTTDIAKILGIPDTQDQNMILTALKDLVLKAQAKQSGIPEDFIRKQQQTDEKLEQWNRQQLANEAYSQFQSVKDGYKLSDAEVSAFADQLVAAGKNPFETRFDLMTEYKLLNYDTLVERARKEAVAAEQARAEKAHSQSTTPNSKQGSGGGAPAPIDSVKALDNLMNSFK